jgi:hypothetical protein
MYCTATTGRNATAFDLVEMLKHQQVNVVGALYPLELCRAAAGRQLPASLRTSAW